MDGVVERMCSLKYWDNRVYMIVVMSCIIIGLSFAVWGCARGPALEKKLVSDLTPEERVTIIKEYPEINMEALPDPTEDEERLPFVPPDQKERKELPVPEQVFSVWKHFPDEEITPTLIASK